MCLQKYIHGMGTMNSVNFSMSSPTIPHTSPSQKFLNFSRENKRGVCEFFYVLPLPFPAHPHSKNPSFKYVSCLHFSCFNICDLLATSAHTPPGGVLWNYSHSSCVLRVSHTLAYHGIREFSF